MSQPVELFAKGILPALFRCGGLSVSLNPLLDIGRISSFKGIDGAVMHLPHMIAYLIKKPAVMRNHDKGTLTLWPKVCELCGKPLYGMHIKMVGRLIHQDDIPCTRQKTCKITAAALSAGKLSYGSIPIKISHQLIDDTANACIGCPYIFRGIPHDGLANRCIIIQRILLAQISYMDIAAPNHLALIGR